MSRNAQAPPPPSVWQAQYLRLISFPMEPQFAVSQAWWNNLTGAERESRVEKKREVEEEGTFEGVSLSLNIDLLRLQWSAVPRVLAENVEGAPTLGPFMEKKDWFRNLMRRWLQTSPPIKRLAFSGVLLQPVESREAGYALLDRYLRWVDIDPQSSDLLYRINRPVAASSVAGLRANRLITWSVAEFVVVVRAQLAASGQENQQQTARARAHHCVLELDINTVPGSPDRELPHDALPRIFDELVNFGVDIATRGDVRND